jgi:uncharacterized membrane protein
MTIKQIKEKIQEQKNILICFGACLGVFLIGAIVGLAGIFLAPTQPMYILLAVGGAAFSTIFGGATLLTSLAKKRLNKELKVEEAKLHEIEKASLTEKREEKEKTAAIQRFAKVVKAKADDMAEQEEDGLK